MKFIITFKCDCGSTIKQNNMCVGIDTVGVDTVEIPWNYASQNEFECNECGAVYFTGDFDYKKEEDDK